MASVDLRYLQAASNRYVKEGFRPLPLDGKTSPQLKSDLEYDLAHINIEVAGPDDSAKIDKWLTALATKVNAFGAPDERWLAENAAEITAFLNENADYLGLPAAESVGGAGGGLAPRTKYLIAGGVAAALLLGFFALSRVERAPSPL
jgi:hypothetical protein